jgi:hypothetical protein
MSTPSIDRTTCVRRDLLDERLGVYDVVVTEHTVVLAAPEVVFRAARELDFLTIGAPLVPALMTARAWPSKLLGRAVVAPRALRLAEDASALPGWLSLGEVADREIVFGAVGKFWKADIEWLETVSPEQFADFDEPGWGKIACHLLVRPDGPGRSVLSYECRTGTTDAPARALMARYWWLIRPFVGYILRATLRAMRAEAETVVPCRDDREPTTDGTA